MSKYATTRAGKPGGVPLRAEPFPIPRVHRFSIILAKLSYFVASLFITTFATIPVFADDAAPSARTPEVRDLIMMLDCPVHVRVHLTVGGLSPGSSRAE